MEKIMDFCGSGELLTTMLSDVHFCEALENEMAGRKVTMMVFAEDDKATLQGNDLSVNVEDDLQIGICESEDKIQYQWRRALDDEWKDYISADAPLCVDGFYIRIKPPVKQWGGESMEQLDGRYEPEYQPKFGPDKNGWIEWRGGECPVPAGSLVRVKLRGGFAVSPAGLFQPNYFRWDHKNTEIDIVAYKLADQFSAERGDDEESQV